MSQDQKSRVVFILGVHRSGASSLAQIVYLLGAHFGESFIPPVNENDALVSWEHKGIVRVHDEILHSLASNRLDPSPLPAAWWENREIGDQRQRLIDILNREFLGESIWCINDHRLCRLFPLWRTILSELPCEPSCFIVVRNPKTVAQSLAKHDYLPRETSCLIWLDHLLKAEEHTRGLPRSIVHFEDLLEDWETCLGRASENIGLEWPKTFGEIEGPRNSLRHFQTAEYGFLGLEEVPTWIHDVYRSLHGNPTSGELCNWERDLVELGNEFQRAAELIKGYTEQPSLEKGGLLQKPNLTQDKLSPVRMRHSEQTRQMEAEIRATKLDHEANDKRLEAAVDVLKRQHRKKIKKLKKHHRAERRRQSELNDTTLEKQAECYEASVVHLQEKLEASEGVLNQILESRSWVLTAPLRSAKRRLAALRIRFARRTMKEPVQDPSEARLETPPSLRKKDPRGDFSTSHTVTSSKDDSSTVLDDKMLVEGGGGKPSKCVLVVDQQFPKPDQDSGSVRAYNILKIMRKIGFGVHFYSDALEYPSRYTRDLEAAGVRCLFASKDGPLQCYLANCGIDFDTVILSRIPIAEKYLGLIRERFTRAKVVFDTVDLYYLREAREAEVLSGTVNVWEVQRQKVLELAAARFSDVTWVVSKREREILLKEDPEIRAEVVSNIVPPQPTRASFSARSDIVFLGGFAHKPNVDAARHYVRDIHPLVRQHLPRARFYIVGSKPPPEVRSLESEDIIVTGYVPDLKPYYKRFRISVVPLRFGAGVKGKINTSLSFGVPVVTTPVGAEGMGLVPGKHALIASEPRDFASAIKRLYADEALWGSLREAGLEHLRCNYSIERAEQTIATCLSVVTGDDRST